jgi:hypothetical protein
MPNQRAPDKQVMAFYLSRTMVAKVRKAASERRISMSHWMREVIEFGTADVELDDFELDQIERATRRARGGK